MFARLLYAQRRPFIFLACLCYSSLPFAAFPADLRQTLEAVAAEHTADWSADARYELNALIEETVVRASADSTTLTTSQIGEAESNFRRLLHSFKTSHGIENQIPRQLEQVRQGRYSLCPLWPFC